jgi:hypothetical protein
VLLKWDLPLSRVSREELVHGGAADAVSAKPANDEELGHQSHLRRQVAHERESHRARAAVEHVRGSIRVVVEERQQGADVELPVPVGERPAEPRRPMRPAELREIVPIELPEALDDRSSLRRYGMDGELRRHPR